MTTALSERELQILRLVAEGFSNRQIAGMLDISENTVKVHVRKIFAKINVASRTEASIYAVRQGLIVDIPKADELVVDEVTAHHPSDEVMVTMPVRRLSRSLMMGVGVILVLLVGIGVWWQSRDVFQVSPPIVHTPDTQHWSQMVSLPMSEPGMQLITVAGELYVIGGSTKPDLWRYDASGDAWIAMGGIPLQSAFLFGWSDATGVWGIESATRVVWSWDGTTWHMYGVLPAGFVPVDMVRVAGNLVILDGTTARIWRSDDARTTTWESYSMPMIYTDTAQLVVIDDVLYLFGDQRTVWRSLDQGRSWLRDGQLLTAWNGGVAVPVLDSIMLMRDGTQSLYILARGEGSPQSIPITIGASVSATIWQTMVVIGDTSDGQVHAYQFVFQSFMPMMR